MSRDLLLTKTTLLTKIDDEKVTKVTISKEAAAVLPIVVEFRMFPRTN